MPEYIESICRRCFHSYVCEQFNEHRDSENEKCHFFNDHFVPAADVVAVVRCKDCKHNLGCEGNFIQCGYWLDIVKSNGFCSYGERRADNATD